MQRWSLIVAALALLGSLAAPPATGEGVPGIRWEADLDAALLRAAREGRPTFLAINALEDERANQQLANVLYRSPAWGEASRDYVCLVANMNDHAGGDGSCSRYPGIPCDTHRSVTFFVYRVLGLPGDVTVISPQHLILDPDGRLAWRKEYYTGVVGPDLLESVLPKLSPSSALDRAARLRSARIEKLEQVPTEELEGAARTWLGEGDPLAAAGVQNAIDYALDDQRRLALVRSMAAVPANQRPVAMLGAYECSLAPDQDPDQALAYAKAMLQADRPTGARLLARIAVRTGDAGLRGKALEVWFGGPARKRRLPDELAGEERAAAAEVYALLGRGDAWGRSEDPPDPFRARLARAKAIARGSKAAPRREAGAISKLLADEEALPGPLAKALLGASPGDVRRHEAKIRPLFRESPWARVRTAAAIAMWNAGLDEAGRITPFLWNAVQDPIEGPDVRLALVERLDEDPGWSEEAWFGALNARLAGGAK